MSLHEPSQLNRERVEYWKRQQGIGKNLTAFAVSILDKQAPTMFPVTADHTYAYEEQFLLTNCVLDGHHRIQAAVEIGAPVRILSFLARDFSLVRNTDDIVAVVRKYSPLVPLRARW